MAKFIELSDGSKVTVGRDVHYWPTEDDLDRHSELVSITTHEPWAAKVIRLLGNNRVLLIVFRPVESTSATTLGGRGVAYDPNRAPGTWSWPEKV